MRSANTAEIDLAWDAGPRHRFGAVRFTDAQFPDKFLQSYKPWRDGEFYSTDKLLELQQSLVDADYFSSVAVTPDLEHVADGVGARRRDARAGQAHASTPRTSMSAPIPGPAPSSA